MANAYRDGWNDARRAFAERCDELHVRAARLGRRGLPDALRRELAEHEAALRKSPRTLTDMAALEPRLRAFGRALDAAEVLLPQIAALRRRGRRRLATRAFAGVALLGLLGLVAWPRWVELTEDCADAWSPKAPNPARLLTKEEPRCVATDQTHCLYECMFYGACAIRDGACVATSARRCASSARCDASGECGFALGECRVVSEADCVTSESCARDGACSLGLDDDEPACVPASDAQCAASRRCRSDGECWLVDGACRTASARCRLAEVCWLHGACSGDGESCVVGTDEDCRESALCLLEGRCSAVDGACRATSDASCSASPACRLEGRCHAREGACMAT